MSFGFSVRKDDGRLWCSPDVTPMVFHEKITLPPGIHYSFTTSVPKTLPIMIFYKTTFGIVGAWVSKRVDSGATHSYALTGYQNLINPYRNEFEGGLEFYIFTIAKNFKPNSHGLNIFNNKGDLTYSAEMIPLDLKYKKRSEMPKSGPLDGGASYKFNKVIAVMPALVYDFTATTGNSGMGTRWETRRYISSTNSKNEYTERLIVWDSTKISRPRYWGGIEKIFYIETEIYDRYITLKK